MHASSPRSRWLRRAVGVGLLSTVAALTACASPSSVPESSSSAEGDSPPASFVYDISAANPTIAMAPFTAVPDVLGYWSEDNLDVELVSSDGSSAALQALVGGRADIVSSGLNAVYSAAAENPDLRVVSLAPDNVWRIAVLEDSDIQSIDDLRGKDVGVISMTSGSYTYGKAIVEASGLDSDTDINWLPVGQGSQSVEALQSGRVVAYSSYDGPLDVVANLTELGMRPIPSPLDEVAGSIGYVVTKQTLEERPNDIIRFLRGIYRGNVFSEANPEAAVQVYWQRYPEQQPVGMSDQDAIAEAVATATNSWKNRGSVGDEDRFGYLRPERVTQAAEFFETYKIIEGSADADLTVDLSLTREANEFDRAEIEQQASAWTP